MLSGLTDDTSDWPESIGDYTDASDWYLENPYDCAGPLKEDENGTEEKTAANS
jgi:hypothetical protein